MDHFVCLGAVGRICGGTVTFLHWKGRNLFSVPRTEPPADYLAPLLMHFRLRTGLRQSADKVVPQVIDVLAPHAKA